MKKIMISIASMSIAITALAFDVSIVADHHDCIYRCGEEAVFMITAREKDGSLTTNGNIEVSLDNFGSEQFSTEKFDLAKTNPITVKGTLAKPGFLRANANGKMFSCGFEPEKIKQGAECPSDFDAFWANAIKQTESLIPLDPIVTPVPEKSTKDFTVSRVSFATTNNRRVYGWLSVPTDKSKAPFPVCVHIPGAGCNGGNRPCTSSSTIHLLMSVFPYEPDGDFSKVLPRFQEMEKELKEKYNVDGYPYAGIASSREDYFYYPVIIGVNRAVNWLATRDDIDRKAFAYEGTSQGGAFGFYLLALNKNFTRGAIYVPALTDLLAAKNQNRRSGWPQIYEKYPEEQKESVAKNIQYFDGVNFAARIHIPVRVVVGFSDNTCPPGAVYAGYNVIPSKDKKIFHGIGMGHGVLPEFGINVGKWVGER